MPSPSFRHPFPLVLESPRDLQFSEIGETSAKVSWTPPSSRADSFKVSYQLVDGGDPFCPCPRWSQVPCALRSAHPAALLASPQPLKPTVFSGEPRSVQVGGGARTQQLRGLVPGAHYEVTVVSVRGFEESEPLTGFLTTGEGGRGRPGGRAAQGPWRELVEWPERGGVSEGPVMAQRPSEFGKEGPLFP